MDWVLDNASLLLLILAGVLIVFGALLGLFRGFKRAFIRFLTVAIAFFGSLFACRFFLVDPKRVLDHPWTQKLLDLLRVTEYLEQLKEEVPKAYDFLIGLPVAVLSPIVFTALFLVAAFFLELVYFIIGFFAGPKRSGRLLGMIVGAVQGAVVTVAIMVPLCGLLSHAVSAIETIEAEKDPGYTVEAVDQLSEYKQQMTAVTDAPIFKLVDKVGTPICNSLMRYKVDGVEINVGSEIDNTASIYAHAFPLMDTPLKEYSQKQIQALYQITGNDKAGDERIEGDVSESRLLPYLLSRVLNAAGESWSKDEEFLSVAVPDMSDDFDKVMNEFFEILKTTNTDPIDDRSESRSTIVTDLKTIVDLLDVFERHGMFPIIDNSDAVKNKFATEPKIIDEMREILNKYPRYQKLCDELERAAFRSVVVDVIDIPEKGTPEYHQFQTMTGDVANILNNLSSDDRIAFIENPSAFIGDSSKDFGDDITSALEDYLGDIDEDQMNLTKDLIADAINEEFGEAIREGKTDFSAEEIEDFLRRYSGN